MNATALFQAEINQPDSQIDLAKAALYIAQIEYPDLDIDEYLNALDTMAQDVEELLPASRYPLRVVQSINRYLYEDLQFKGNESDYYNPCNSFLNDVIDRRTGIPITLSLVYLEIAKRIDFPMCGIGMPGHFIIRPDFPETEIFIDAFNRGEIMFVEDCRQKLMDIYQQHIPALPTEILQPVSKKHFLLRMLNNLQIIYLDRANFDRALIIKNWITTLVTH
jgi:regulator of sirC expression with transglutaminase-like and TPR domain